MKTPQVTADFESLVDYLKRSRGFDFTGYKRPSLIRRINRRMETVGIKQYEAYQDYLEVHPEEFAHLFNTILINVTGFFRDESSWEYLASEIIPRILKNKSEAEALRVWSAGAASGEEAYSIAMLLNEAMGLEGYLKRVKIFATDLDEQAL